MFNDPLYGFQYGYTDSGDANKTRTINGINLPADVYTTGSASASSLVSTFAQKICAASPVTYDNTKLTLIDKRKVV